jgi:hypothetical protein
MPLHSAKLVLLVTCIRDMIYGIAHQYSVAYLLEFYMQQVEMKKNEECKI